MMICYPHPSLILGLLSLVGGIVGCGSEAKSDHLEHHVPAHRPHDLGEAVQVILVRWEALEREWQADPVAARQKLSELIDIVRWLPEIAADSDLAEADWNRVQAISNAWLDDLVPLSRSAATATTSFPKFTANEQLEVLKGLAPKAHREHGHTHDHHHGHSHD
ncbi:hypothetical protein ETAA8_53760 [Anatilimnocola aggregata]|uniref:Uncharacterized protein n=1 Tax=Anatilimnocola aggregata TaxID=2528021 RepID=A0A517YJ50_9BACT|nr:hypothetical protein [Anatilimnocola aggregata]QDU30257.1 hypothetical protein ETAA8_53760 [Anatilimnocola aggregata]